MESQILIMNPVIPKVEIGRPLKNIPVDRVIFDDCCCMDDPCGDCLRQHKEKSSGYDFELIWQHKY